MNCSNFQGTISCYLFKTSLTYKKFQKTAKNLNFLSYIVHVGNNYTINSRLAYRAVEKSLKFVIAIVLRSNDQMAIADHSCLSFRWCNVELFPLTYFVSNIALSTRGKKKHSNNFQEHDCLRYLKVPHFSSLLKERSGKFKSRKKSCS